MAPDRFHPAIRSWVETALGTPTGVQGQAWPAIAEGRSTLIAAPTGSGKTLAAFLAVLDDLLNHREADNLSDSVQVVYVTPLKALSNDIRKNLEAPLAGIEEELAKDPPEGPAKTPIRSAVRTGDTPRSERDAMRRRPPHILVTTPESLYILLTSASGRRMLATARTAIVDELHALASTKRGAHLALSLERLEALTQGPLTRIGLSATQRPIEEAARFLVGSAEANASDRGDCRIIDAGHYRRADLALEVPDSPIEAVMAGEVWEEVYDRIAALAVEHRTTLVFANTRRTAERVARHLGERLGPEAVAAHHGSLSRERRLEAERALKSGEIRLLVATASLELGIDIGEVDLVVQLGSTRTIANFLQRVGRSGHRIDAVPKGRLFPLSRDDLVESIALIRAARDGELDRLEVPAAPLDVLAQQIAAETAGAGEWEVEALYHRFRGAYPYQGLSRADFDTTVAMLAEGFATGRGRRGALVHHDPVGGRLRPRRGTRLTAITCGGTIPDEGDFDVVLEPTGQVIGSVNEDFALEAVGGDIFQLGNHSYRFLRIQGGRVRVEDAAGQPPSLPFWFGEAPSRSQELTRYVSDLREGVAQRLDGSEGQQGATAWLAATEGVSEAAAEQAVTYLAAGKAALGALPTLDTVILERFFDESGGMQLLVHSPFGSRINRAWGLALRKRFCRKFNFELQAAALEDTIILSLASAHSFPLEEVARYLSPESVGEVLTQALLDAPLFTTRWRWNATTAQAIRRFRNGARTPPQLQRMEAEDLLSAIFPDQIACQENLAGDREVPDHPLVGQTLHDCLHGAMDLDGLRRTLEALGDGSVTVVARDLTEPSPLAHEILGARPYAFLDDAPAEERRTRMVQARRHLDPTDAAELGQLDAEAIARVRQEAWPQGRDADELQDALAELGAVTAGEGKTAGWGEPLRILQAEGRGGTIEVAPGHWLWVAVEGLPQLQAVFPEAPSDPEGLALPGEAPAWDRESAIRELVRGRLQGLGPITTRDVAAALALPPEETEAALASLEAEGAVFRGQFTPGTDEEEWCERRLLARIHKYTLDRLRQEIEPVQPADFLAFLLDWHGLTEREEGGPDGPEALLAVLEQLEGLEVPAQCWEGELLPARLPAYDPQCLDQLCQSGRVVWGRFNLPTSGRGQGKRSGPVRTTPIAIVQRKHLPDWKDLTPRGDSPKPGLSGRGQRVLACLEERGAQFFDELASCSGLLRAELEGSLAELVARGRASSDSFAGLRALLAPSDRRRRRGRRQAITRGRDVEEAGRWTALIPTPPQAPEAAQAQIDPGSLETAAWALLRRYGIVFRAVLTREPDWLPPWRELLRVYRRLEDRGEVRGGRFVAGFWGEQFALPEAVAELRRTRRRESGNRAIVVPAADPLNLVGIITPGNRVPAVAGNRVLFRDGVSQAIRVGGRVRTPSGEEPTEEDRYLLTGARPVSI